MPDSCRFCGDLKIDTVVELYTVYRDYEGPTVRNFPCKFCGNCEQVFYGKEQTEVLRVLIAYFYDFKVEIPFEMEYDHAYDIYLKQKENYPKKTRKKKESIDE
jgi:hypothetical protein